MEVSLPRPRPRTGPAFDRIKELVLDRILQSESERPAANVAGTARTSHRHPTERTRRRGRVAACVSLIARNEPRTTMARSAQKRLHLGAIITAAPARGLSAPGVTRRPSNSASRRGRTTSTSLARSSAASSNLIFFADKLAVPGRFPKSVEDNLRNGSWGAAHPDPMLLLASIAAATERIGLASTISTSYNAPFSVARTVATLDHLSKGRAAWNVVTSTEDSEAQNFGLHKQRERGTRYDIADEFLRVVFGLWDTWEDGALRMDREARVVIDPNKVHLLNHEGKALQRAWPAQHAAHAPGLSRDRSGRLLRSRS